MSLPQQILGADIAADLPASELLAAVAASRGLWSSSLAAMTPIPRPLDSPRHSPNADPLTLRGGLGPQEGGAIAGAQILLVGEGLAAAHHYQVGVLAITEHLSNGAAVLVDGLGAERDVNRRRAISTRSLRAAIKQEALSKGGQKC